MKGVFAFLVKPSGKTIIAAVISFLLLFVMLGVEPSTFIQKSAVGWIVVRLIVLVYALFLGLLTFTEGNFKPVVKEAKLEIDNLKKYGYNSADKVFASASMLGWLAWWVIATQAMAAFYISDWCAFGF